MLLKLDTWDKREVPESYRTPNSDIGNGKGGTPFFTGGFEPLAGVIVYLTENNMFSPCAWRSEANRSMSASHRTKHW